MATIPASASGNSARCQPQPQPLTVALDPPETEAPCPPSSTFCPGYDLPARGPCAARHQCMRDGRPVRRPVPLGHPPWPQPYRTPRQLAGSLTVPPTLAPDLATRLSAALDEVSP